MSLKSHCMLKRSETAIEAKLAIGLIVNPIAGMGGSVGLKGTDGPETPELARALGATPKCLHRARQAMEVVATVAPGAEVCVAAGSMGADALSGLDLRIDCITVNGTPSAGETRRIAGIMCKRSVSMLVFAGGDGTARDVVSVTGLETPVLGIPGGVKMHSGVFAVGPKAAGRLVTDLLLPGSRRIGFRKVEIMDIDEAELRHGNIQTRLYGYARAPYARLLLQAAKGHSSFNEDVSLQGACNEIASEMCSDVLYLVGPGTTAKRVLSALGLEGTLLGVDAVRNGRMVGMDVTEQQALALAGTGKVGVVVGVTGQQGFVFGRGNQQIGPEIIRRAGTDRITIVASAGKLAVLPEPLLRIDSGDPELDRAMRGYRRVRVGSGQSMMMRME